MHWAGAIVFGNYWRPQSVWPDWAIFCTLGNHSKPVATIILPKSPTLLANFCKGVKIIHFSSEIIFWQLSLTFGDFYLVTLAPISPKASKKSDLMWSIALFRVTWVTNVQVWILDLQFCGYWRRFLFRWPNVQHPILPRCSIFHTYLGVSFKKTVKRKNEKPLSWAMVHPNGFVLFFKWAIPVLFFFILVFSTVNSKHVHYKISPMTALSIWNSLHPNLLHLCISCTKTSW